MWRCITFFESFRSGKRILAKEQILHMIKKVLEELQKIDVPPLGEPQEAIFIPELQPALDQQNIIRKIFIPALSSSSSDFERHITGMFFVEYDPLLDRKIQEMCFQEKKLWRSSVVKESDVEKIINSVRQTIEIAQIKKGDVIEVTDGDYKGIIGRVENVENGLCAVHIQIFGCEKTLNLSIDQLKIADDEG